MPAKAGKHFEEIKVHPHTRNVAVFPNQNVSVKKKATFLGGSVGGVAVASSNHVNIYIGASRKNFRVFLYFFTSAKKPCE